MDVINKIKQFVYCVYTSTTQAKKNLCDFLIKVAVATLRKVPECVNYDKAMFFMLVTNLCKLVKMGSLINLCDFYLCVAKYGTIEIYVTCV